MILYSCTNLSLSDPWKGESNIWPSSCHWCAWKPPGTHSQILLCCCPIWLNSAADICMFNEIFFWYCELFLWTKMFLYATWSLHFSNIKTCVNLFFFPFQAQCEAVGKVADIIQIPAFLCRQVQFEQRNFLQKTTVNILKHDSEYLYHLLHA